MLNKSNNDMSINFMSQLVSICQSLQSMAVCDWAHIPTLWNIIKCLSYI